VPHFAQLNSVRNTQWKYITLNEFNLIAHTIWMNNKEIDKATDFLNISDKSNKEHSKKIKYPGQGIAYN